MCVCLHACVCICIYISYLMTAKGLRKAEEIPAFKRIKTTKATSIKRIFEETEAEK